MGAIAVPLMIASSVVGALGALQAGRQEARVADYNAQIAQANAAAAQTNAAAEREWAAADAEQARRVELRRQGRFRAAAGASGMDVGSGSFLDVLSDDAIQAELDALSLLRMGERRAQGYEQQAQGHTMQGEAFRMQARSARASTPLSVLGAAIGPLSPLATSRYGGLSGGGGGTTFTAAGSMSPGMSFSSGMRF